MKKLQLRSILSLALAICFIISSTGVCYAYDGNVGEITNANDEEGGTPLETIPDNGGISRSGYISDLAYTSTSTGIFGGYFDVPSYEANSLIKVHWRVAPQSGANTSAVFKMTISGNGVSQSVLLGCDTNSTAYSIATLPEGRYRFDVSPYSNVQGGSYICFYRFYAF